MKIDQELLNKIESLAQLLFTPEEIGVMLELDETDYDFFCKSCLDKNYNYEIFRSYNAGRFTVQIEVRKSLILAAKHGSPPSQKMFEQLFFQSKFNY